MNAPLASVSPSSPRIKHQSPCRPYGVREERQHPLSIDPPHPSPRPIRDRLTRVIDEPWLSGVQQ